MTQTTTIHTAHAANRLAYAIELADAAERMLAGYRANGCRTDIVTDDLHILVGFTCPANAAALLLGANDCRMHDLLVLMGRSGTHSRRPSWDTVRLAAAIAASHT